ncbi:AAA family ATPase, partial [Candidatus Gottesmanbacteria bacterium]|nr:AAA family ATPase [Candidatus Gottesmanbacteria bacterium]
MNTVLRTLLYEWKERKLPTIIERDTLLDTSLQQGTNNATVITGFRRVGKTYLLYQTLEKLLKTYSRSEVVYINFEDERIIAPSTS